VSAGVAVLCLLPAIAAARPAPRVQIDAGQLRERILASAPVPYQGHADSRGGLRLPDLRELEDVNALLTDTTARVWYGSPQAWRVAVIQQTGERDVYRAGQLTYVWDFERNLVTEITGELPIRLPWAADLMPPDLARRLLRAAPGDPVVAIGARRVAGVAAAGLRLTPSDPDSAIGRVDIWADPRTGLPVQVEVGGRGNDRGVLVTRFLELRQQAPAAGVLTPPYPPQAGFTRTRAPDVAARINGVASVPLPATLAGKSRSSFTGLVGVGGYGAGLATFLVVPLPGRLGGRTIRAVRDAGALAVKLPVEVVGGEAYEVRASLLTTVVVRTSNRTYLLAGFVSTDLLERAAAELLVRPR
jgi:hypothetical protein